MKKPSKLIRLISSGTIKERLVKEMEKQRSQIEAKLGHGIDQKITAKSFKRLNKYKASYFGGWAEGKDTDIWIRDFEYQSPYWGTLPFYYEVKTNANDSKIIKITAYKHGGN